MENINPKKELKKYLDTSPLDIDEISKWEDKLDILSNQEATEVLDLLKQKESILEQANKYLVKMAEKLYEDRIKDADLKKDVTSILNLKFANVLAIFKSNLVRILRNSNINLIYQLDEYLHSTASEGGDVLIQMDEIKKAMLKNNELIFPDLDERKKLYEWLTAYISSTQKEERKSIERLTFSNSDSLARKLDAEDRGLLLRLIEVYDFLDNPNTFKNKGELVLKSSQKISVKDIENIEPELTEKNLSVNKEKQEMKEKIAEIIAQKKQDAISDKDLEDLAIYESLADEQLKYSEDSYEYKALAEEMERLEK